MDEGQERFTESSGQTPDRPETQSGRADSAIARLREVAKILGHSPRVEEYREIRRQLDRG